MITRQSSIPLSRIDALFHLHPTKYMAARSAPTTVGRRRMRWLKPPPVPLRYKLRLAWILQPTSSPPISQRLQQAAPVTAIPSTPRPRSCQRPEDGQAQMNEKIQKAQSFILAKFGYDIGSSPMLYEAINIAGDHTIQAQKASLDLNPDRRQSQTNKRLAHVGDAAIGAVIKIHGFRHGLSRGETVLLFQSTVTNERLAAFAQSIGLDTVLLKHPGHLGPISVTTMATSLEAVFGAIYLHSGESNDAIRNAMRAIGMTLGPADDV